MGDNSQFWTTLTPYLDDSSQCSLIDGYALFIQFLVGVFGISTLLVKRVVEWPRRPWLTWLFDTSKQTIASVISHLINILASTLSGHTGRKLYPSSVDPCAWYLTSVLVDGTLLLGLLAIMLKLIDFVVEQKNVPAFRHGDYGDPPSYSVWSIQLITYILLFLTAKATCLYVLYKHSGVFLGLANWLLQPVDEHRHLKVTIILFSAPLLTTIIQYWTLDQLLKSKWQPVESEYHSDQDSDLNSDQDSDLDRDTRYNYSNEQRKIFQDIAKSQGLVLDCVDDHDQDELLLNESS